MTNLRSAAVMLGALLLIPVLAFARSPEGSFQKSFPVTGPADLQVFTHSGDIAIRTGPAGTVSITGKIYTNKRWFSGTRTDAVSRLEKNPPIEQNGNSIHIGYVNEDNVSIDFEIIVPADTAVHTHSNSGDQTLEGIHRSLSLESDSGDMHLQDISGEVHTRTGSGDWTGRQIAGPIYVQTGSGDIRLEQTGEGETHLRTGSGDVDVQGIKGPLYLDSGSGDVALDGNITASWTIHTGSGDVRINLPSPSGFDLDASTGSGDLYVGHTVAASIQGNPRKQHALAGKVGGGGPSLVVRTGSGDVQIR